MYKMKLRGRGVSWKLGSIINMRQLLDWIICALSRKFKTSFSTIIAKYSPLPGDPAGSRSRAGDLRCWARGWLCKFENCHNQDDHQMSSPDKAEGDCLVLDGLGGEVPSLLPAVERHQVHVELLQLAVIIKIISPLPRNINNVSHKHCLTAGYGSNNIRS